MKKKCAIAAAAGLLAMVVSSCNSKLSSVQDAEPVSEKAMGSIRLELKRNDAAEVKSATSYTASRDYETAINYTQFFVFDKNSGRLEKHLYDEDAALKVDLSVPTGEKTVWAMTNYGNLEFIKDEAELKDYVIDISENSIYPEDGFIMAGSADVTVSAGKIDSCVIKVSRYLSRIALASVKNSIPTAYDVVLKWACLTNALGNANLGMTDSSYNWCNPMGRSCDEPVVESHIIDGNKYVAGAADLTFASINMTSKLKKGSSYTPSAPHLFYGFPNSSTVEPDGFTSDYKGSKTVLVVAATLNDELMYYPIVLDKLERNKTYTVYLTLLGPGSDDPNMPVTKSSVGVTLQVEPWIDGGVIESEI